MGLTIDDANEILLERQSPTACPCSSLNLIPKVTPTPLAILAVNTLTGTRREGRIREEPGKPTTALKE